MFSVSLRQTLQGDLVPFFLEGGRSHQDLESVSSLLKDECLKELGPEICQQDGHRLIWSHQMRASCRVLPHLLSFPVIY